MKHIFYIFILIIGFNLNTFSQTTEDHNARVIHFYPNPAVNYINFELSESAEKDLSLQIFNFIGKKVIDLPNINSRINLPLDDFFRGIYIYQLRNKGGKIIESGKFQVIK